MTYLQRSDSLATYLRVQGLLVVEVPPIQQVRLLIVGGLDLDGH
jgi:hypothetical protein